MKNENPEYMDAPTDPAELAEFLERLELHKATIVGHNRRARIQARIDYLSNDIVVRAAIERRLEKLRERKDLERQIKALERVYYRC